MHEAKYSWVMFTKNKKYLASMRDGFERYWHRTSAAYVPSGSISLCFICTSDQSIKFLEANCIVDQFFMNMMDDAILHLKIGWVQKLDVELFHHTVWTMIVNKKKTSRRHIVSCDSGISERFATCKKPNMHSVTSKPNICSRLASTNKELFRMISKLRL